MDSYALGSDQASLLHVASKLLIGATNIWARLVTVSIGSQDAAPQTNAPQRLWTEALMMLYWLHYSNKFGQKSVSTSKTIEFERARKPRTMAAEALTGSSRGR